MREHEGAVITEFNGLFDRGGSETTPPDHFLASNNIKHKGSNIYSRDGITPDQDINLQVPLQNITRLYNYPTLTKNTIIALSYDRGTNTGSIYHCVDSATTYGPLLSIVGMKDFAFLPYAGRGYISPFASFQSGSDTVEKGLNGEFLYVYRGDGSTATKAAGSGMTGTMTVAAGAAGHTDAGFHVYGVVSETDTGYLSPPTAFGTFTNLPAQSVSFGTIPTSGDPHVVKRHIVASKAINGYNGDPTGYDLFFIPGADINNNTSTFLNNISFFDADLLEDASHLLDNYTEIPAGAFICLYHNRLVTGSMYDDFNRVLVSAAGEPEAISQIDGLLATQPDGNPVTNGAEFRDVLYITKPSSTMSFTDNGGEPATWPYVPVDAALGTRPHGIAIVLDKGSQNVDFLIICTYQGIHLFTGGYQTPELTWKIENFWKSLNRPNFGKLSIVNNVIKKRLYIVLPGRYLLVGFYQNGLNPKDIQWEQWMYTQPVNTLAVARIDEDIVGCDIY